MINPLQAMAQARQANQMGGLGVQSQGAQQMTPLLQQSQMNVANPQMMQAQPARLMEMDKYRYVNAAQDRALADKQLLFNALQKKEAIQQQNALAQQQHQQALQLAQIEQENKKKLATFTVNEQMRIANEKQQADIKMANERFPPKAREAFSNVISKHQDWHSGGMDRFRNAEYNQQIKRNLPLIVSNNDVDLEFARKVDGQPVYQSVPKPGSAAYENMRMKIFQQQLQNPKSTVSASNKAIIDNINTQAREIGMQLSSAYNQTLETIRKIPISLPDSDAYVTPSAPDNSPFKIDSISDLPALVGGAGTGTGGNTSDNTNSGLSTTQKLMITGGGASTPYIVDRLNKEATIRSTKNKLDEGEFSKKKGGSLQKVGDGYRFVEDGTTTKGEKLKGAALHNRRYQLFKDMSKGTDVPSLTKKEVAGMSNRDLSKHINKIQDSIITKIANKLKIPNLKLGKGGLALILGGGIYTYLSAMDPEERAEVQSQIDQIKVLQDEKTALDNNFTSPSGLEFDLSGVR